MNRKHRILMYNQVVLTVRSGERVFGFTLSRGAIAFWVGSAAVSLGLSSGLLVSSSPSEERLQVARAFLADRPRLVVPNACDGFVLRQTNPDVALPNLGPRQEQQGAEAPNSLEARTPAETALESSYLAELCKEIRVDMLDRRFIRATYAPEAGLWQWGAATGTFVHRSPFSFVLLAIFLFATAGFVEQVLGPWATLALMWFGGSLTIWVSAGLSATPHIGISGAVAAVLGAATFLLRRAQVDWVRSGRTWSLPSWSLALLFVIFVAFGAVVPVASSFGSTAAHVLSLGLGALVMALHRGELVGATSGVSVPAPLGSMAERRLRLARSAMAESRYEAARAQFEEVLAEHPTELEALHGLARLAAIRGDFVAAKIALERLMGECVQQGQIELVEMIVRDLDQFLPVETIAGQTMSPTIRATPPGLALRVANMLTLTHGRLALSFFESAGQADGLIGAKSLVSAAELASRLGLSEEAVRLARLAMAHALPEELRQKLKAVFSQSHA